MVNTFLVCADYRSSARCLDDERLNKQGTEALELIQSIANLRIVSNYFGYTLPADNKDWPEWIKTIVRHYATLNYRLVVDDSTGQIVGFYPAEPGVTAKYIPQYCQAGRIVRLGYRPVSHPVTRAWLLWLDSLKEYYNAHIEEWIARGKGNTRPIFYVPPNSERPPWTNDPRMHLMYQACLANKELNPKPRKNGRGPPQPYWYREHCPWFFQALPFTGYIWPL